MSGLHQAWESIPCDSEFSLISADEVRLRSGREPRLMMKFDHSVLLPAKLRENNKFILPLKNGLYAILQGQGYHRPEPCPPAIDFPRQTTFHLATSETGLSEMQHLDLAFNTGLLSDFLTEPVLYPTIRGRKRSPRFDFSVGTHRLQVEGVQVEIDGGYEGRHCVVVVEAKIGECDDFHLRQIYYPYRFWREHSEKRIRPVFFTFDPVDQLYRFREYAFDPVEVYGPPRLVKAAAYRLVAATQGSSKQNFAVRPTVPIPQADKIERIAQIPLLVALGYGDPKRLAERMDFDPRQGRYYLDAACSLGLLDRHYALSDSGEQYIAAPPALRESILARSILGVPLVQEFLVSLLLTPGGRFSKSDLADLVQHSTQLALSTAQRRTQTLWSWLAWVGERGGNVRVERNEIVLLGRSQDGTVSTQLDLFRGN